MYKDKIKIFYKGAFIHEIKSIKYKSCTFYKHVTNSLY